VSSERLRLLLVIMVGGFNVIIIILGNIVVRAAVVGAEDVGFRVLLLLHFSSSSSSELVKVIVRSFGDREIVGLSSQLLAADSGRRLHRFLAEGLIAAPTKWGDALLAWTIWRTAASSPCSGTETLLV
jgi:hypothetical protein